MLKTLMNRYGTPLTTGFFLISAVTGAALFFKLAPLSFHPMHEWLSMILLVPFVLHLAKNWTSLLNYARKGTLFLPLVVAFACAAFFLVDTSGGHAGNRRTAQVVMPMITSAPLKQVAPLAGLDVDTVLQRLRARNYRDVSGDLSLAAIAKASGQPVNDAVMAAFAPVRHSGAP